MVAFLINYLKWQNQSYKYCVLLSLSRVVADGFSWELGNVENTRCYASTGPNHLGILEGELKNNRSRLVRDFQNSDT